MDSFHAASSKLYEVSLEELELINLSTDSAASLTHHDQADDLLDSENEQAFF